MATKTKEQMDAMSARDQIWEALNSTYGQQIEKSNASYDAAIAQQDRSMLQRGMQRSSYGQQILGNMQNQKVKAANDLGTQMTAEYLNRLYQVGRDEKADEQWQANFDEQKRQYEQNFGYQKERDTVSDSQWKQQFDFSTKSADQQLAYNYVTAIIANGGNPSDDLLARAGLSRADADAMKYVAPTVSGGGGGGGYRGGGSGDDGGSGGSDGWLNSLFGSTGSNIYSAATKIAGAVASGSNKAYNKQVANDLSSSTAKKEKAALRNT